MVPRTVARCVCGIADDANNKKSVTTESRVAVDIKMISLRKVTQMLSTRSVGVNLARPFKAGNGQESVRVA
jgi:hypothetical protein